VKGPKINDKYSVMAEINMIPFIDISLVLLIIFMVITPVLMQSQILINRPVVQEKGTPPPANDTPIQVQVNKEGLIYIEGRNIPKDALESELKAVLGVNPKGQSLLIVADRDTAFQNVVTVMDSAKTLGVTKMAVSVLEEKKKRK
jgi:biopolymer transport protein ExbD